MSQDAQGLGRRGVLAGAGALLSATAARAQAPAPQPRRGGTLRVCTYAAPSTLDPITGRNGTDHVFLYPAVETLIDFEPTSMLARPGLAKAWSFPDPKTFVLDLREGVLFHDSTPFDAAAVKINLERAAGDARSNVRTDFDSVRSVEVTGPSQVTLRLSRPDSALPLSLSDRAGMIISPKAIKELGVQTDRQPVGTGAMRVVTYTDNDRVVYVRNDKYWQPDQSYLDGMEIRTIADTATSLRSVMAGENDFAFELSPEQKPLLDRARNLTTVVTPSFRLHTVYLNYSRKPLNDQRVRQALNYAIDRNALNKAVGLGLNQATTTELPKEHWACDPTTVSGYTYDPAKAKALLAEAGYADGCDINFIGWTEQRWQKVQEILMEQMKPAGFRLHLSLGSPGDTATRFFGPGKEGDGRVAVWSGRPDPSQIYRQLFGKGSYYNAGSGETPGVEALLTASVGTTDVEARKAELSKLQHLVLEQGLMLPMMFEAEIVAFHKNVHGYQPNLLGKPKLHTMWMDA
ncbi:ABC transporter substrate-binding protein [Acidisphaera sp. L21]|uniref:ABC transporter substrate-binding protein n=1 Tax=Acidisphaera sp. L21 TaxID=1641851 RepID=UPI00131E24FE|nr:ABC transporter substrate-binding protein [Acidisphaera sp. L21]